MTYRARTEFILHLEHFRNVDLFQQGIYFIKFQIYNEDAEKIYYANPYHHESRSDSDDSGKASFHRLIEPQIFDNAAAFVTKTFFIRYAEETVNFRHVIKFRTEVDCKQFHKEGLTDSKVLANAHRHTNNPFLSTEFFLKVELYYSQPPQHNFAKLVNSPEMMKAEINKATTKFKCVQTRLYQINNCMHSQSTFLPIEFDREYTSLCMLTLHSSMINFTFSAPTSNRPLKPMHIDEDDEESVSTFMENGILVERKFI